MRVFVTGASGWIGSAVVPELVRAGHRVVGMARSEASAGAVAGAGGEVWRGGLDDVEGLRAAAAASDAVVHLAFKHDVAFSGDYQGAVDADRLAIEAFGEALAGSDRPLVIASGTLGLAPGRVATERDGLEEESARTRVGNAQLTLSLAERGVRSVVVRLPPTVHGAGDNGFMATLVGVARRTGVSGYVGANRWPATHRADAAQLFRLALERAPAGSVLHGVAEQEVPLRAVAEVIGRHLDVPLADIAPDSDHFGWLAGFLAMDSPASGEATRDLLGWQPTQIGLLDDLDKGHYFRER